MTALYIAAVQCVGLAQLKSPPLAEIQSETAPRRWREKRRAASRTTVSVVVCGDVGYREKRHGRGRVSLLGGGTRRALGAARGPAGHDVARARRARADEIRGAGVAQGRDRPRWASVPNVSG